jgi:hypothetical protein
MLALGETPRLYEFISIRDFERPKLRGQAASRRVRRPDERLPAAGAQQLSPLAQGCY